MRNYYLLLIYSSNILILSLYLLFRYLTIIFFMVNFREKYFKSLLLVFSKNISIKLILSYLSNILYNLIIPKY